MVLHYLRDWQPLLTELRRILRPGGSLAFSIHHPITGWALSDQADYHRTELVRENWNWDGLLVTAGMYRRPLRDIFGSLRSGGFLVDVVEEPLPVSVSAGDQWITNILATQPVFLFVRAIRAAE